MQGLNGMCSRRACLRRFAAGSLEYQGHDLAHFAANCVATISGAQTNPTGVVNTIDSTMIAENNAASGSITIAVVMLSPGQKRRHCQKQTAANTGPQPSGQERRQSGKHNAG